MLIKGLVIGLWIVFALLLFYIVWITFRPNADRFNPLFRKLWYMFYLFGVCWSVSIQPLSIFTDWENYLIALIGFVIVDSLVFLELHVSKIGGHELKSTKYQINETQEKLDLVKKKMARVPEILISFEFPGYNVSEEEYINNLEKLLGQYTENEDLIVDLLPFETEKEQREALEYLGEERLRVTAKRFLIRGDSIILSNDRIGFWPFIINGKPYVIQLEVTDKNSKVEGVDGTAISTLVTTYSLTVESGGDET